MTKTTKRMTLRELFNKNEAIWVKNKSGAKGSKYSRAGIVTLQAGNGDMIERLLIPPGADPVCLSDMTTYAFLKECPDLFKSIRSGILELLNPGDAERYYSANESRRIAAQKKLSDLINRKHDNVRDVKEIKTFSIQIDPSMSDICMKMKHDVLSEENALELLLEKAPGLSIDDFTYILNNGKHDSIKDWARDQINILTFGSDAEDGDDPKTDDAEDSDKAVEDLDEAIETA